MRSRFTNHSVTTEASWPRSEARFSFGPHEIVVFPPDKEHDPSLHLDLGRAGLSGVEGMSVLSQLLSIAAWLDDTYAVLHDGGSGNPVPVRPRRQTTCYATSILDHWCNSWGPLEDPVARRALAIYREAVNMYRFHSIPYAVLGFYKTLETSFDGRQRTEFLHRELESMISESQIEDQHLREIGHSVGESSRLAEFLHKEGRNAVAHAKYSPAINPDDMRDARRMSVAAQILRPLARRFINQELGVGMNRWDQSAIS